MKKIILLILLILSNLTFADCSKENCESKINKKDNTQIINIENVNADNFNDTYVFYTAIWCGHCKAQYKYLQEIYARHNGNVKFKVIIADDSTTKEEAIKFMNDNNYTFPVYYDRGFALGKNLEIEYYPTVFEYDKENDIYIQINNMLNLTQYNKKFEEEFDNEMRDKLSNIKVVDSTDREYNILDVITDNTLLVYGSPHCPDCIKEIERLLEIKGKRDIVYIIEARKYTFEEYVKFENENKDKLKSYYIKDSIMREKFNINWIPSVTEIKNGKFTGNFIRNDKFLMK